MARVASIYPATVRIDVSALNVLEDGFLSDWEGDGIEESLGAYAALYALSQSPESVDAYIEIYYKTVSSIRS